MARLIIPGHQTGGPGEDAFRKLSVSFSRAIGGLLFAPNSANPFWPLDRNRDAILRAIWDTEVREARIPGMNAYQPDQLSIELVRHGDHLVAVMRFPRLHECACVSAGLWWAGPLESPSPECLERSSRRFLILCEDVGTQEDTMVYDASTPQFQALGKFPTSNVEVFVATMLGRYLEGHSSVPFPTGHPVMARARDEACALVPYFIETIQTYPSVTDYSVKVRIEDDCGIEYFWLENTRWEGGAFHGTIGNDPEVTTSVAYGQTVVATVDQVCDWYYFWDGKMRGNYTIRASLDYMDPEQAARIASVLDPA